MGHSLLHSFVLAQIFGLYMIINAIVMLGRVDYFRAVIQKMEPEHFSIVLGASFGLLLGLFLVDIHNIWVWKPRVVVTVLAWFVLIKSVLWLSMPEKMVSLSKRIYKGMGYYVLVLFMTCFGIILVTRGFYLYMNYPTPL